MRLTIKKDGTAILWVAPNPTTMNAIRSLEGGRRWLKSGGLSMVPSQANIDSLRDHFPVEVESLQDDPPAPATPKSPYELKTDPMPHQEDALHKLRKVTHPALFMEQGTGKTKVAIDIAGELFASGEITGMLVVAPKGVHRQWAISQFPIHYGGAFRSAVWPEVKEEDKAIEPGSDLSLLTINIDAIATEKGMAICQRFIALHEGRVLMIVDESHRIKNATSKRWKAANKLGQQVARRMIMTGTPIAIDLTDEWSQLRWLDESILGFRFKGAFRNEYCLMGGYMNKKVIGHRNVERFRERTDPHTFRVTREEIGLMPPVHTPWRFSLTDRQRHMIKGMKEDLLAAIESGEITTAANAAVAFLRMQQISNGFIMDADTKDVTRIMSVKDNPRVAALLDILDSQEGKCIIWARFREDIEIVGEALAATGRPFVTYHGGTSPAKREEAVASFLDPSSDVYFLSNPSAGGTGLNLQGGCSFDVFFSNSDNAIDRWQAEARIDRIGTKGIINHFDLIGIGSPDATILRRHSAKTAISNMGIGELKRTLEEDWI